MSDAPDIAALFGLAGRTALVTGGAAGIGREIARLFHEAGADVIVADIDRDGMASLADELGDRLTAVHTDMADPQAIDALFAGVPRLDVLVNCAAIYPMKAFEEVDVAFLDRMIAIDLRGVFLCTQHAVRLMKPAGGGSIINISSVNSIRACIFDNTSYAVAKGGLNSLVTTLAPEYGEFGIRFNAVLPGGVATDHGMRSVTEFPVRGPIMAPGRVPLGKRLCHPMDIANACLFLASDASAYVTGQLLAVDGGFLVS
jgi:NAD(P)-dependent dehydrogenase (short-subunit alcohol dehydrogenase family)